MKPWLWQAFAAVALVTPAWLAIGFWKRNFGVPSDVFLVWYFAGGALGTYLLNCRGGTYTFYPSTVLVAAMLIFGLTCGALGNMLGFRSVTSAPNAGLAITVLGLGGVATYFATVALSRWLPQYFDSTQIGLRHVLGLALMFAGTALFFIKK